MSNIIISAPQLKAWGESIALSVMQQMGVNTMVSYRQGIKQYGNYFRDAVASGRLVAAHVGAGKNGKRQFAVRDIIALQAADQEKGTIILNP